MTFPNPMPNKEVIDPETGIVTLVPMTEEEYTAAMPALVYPVATEGAAE